MMCAVCSGPILSFLALIRMSLLLTVKWVAVYCGSVFGPKEKCVSVRGPVSGGKVAGSSSSFIAVIVIIHVIIIVSMSSMGVLCEKIILPVEACPPVPIHLRKIKS
jgi:hypothetical protein